MDFHKSNRIKTPSTKNYRILINRDLWDPSRYLEGYLSVRKTPRYTIHTFASIFFPDSLKTRLALADEAADSVPANAKVAITRPAGAFIDVFALAFAVQTESLLAPCNAREAPFKIDARLRFLAVMSVRGAFVDISERNAWSEKPLTRSYGY